ncbi:MAG TPA: zf-HC2 domain-containing protein [Nitriliruptorales bacterium]
MTWHVDQGLLSRYEAGTLDDASAYSIEAHLPACPACQRLAALASDTEQHEAAWLEIIDRVDRPRPAPAERLLGALGLRQDTARLLAATPALTSSWLLAVGAVLGFAAWSAQLRPTAGLAWFLTLAPIIPLAGIATAFGPGVDPTHEIGVAAPMHGLRLLLLRSATVLVSSVLLAALAATTLPHIEWYPVAWILPALALSVAALALGAWLAPPVAAVVVGAAWAVGVATASELSGSRLAAFGTTGQLVALVVIVVATAIVITRRRRLEVLGRRPPFA